MTTYAITSGRPKQQLQSVETICSWDDVDRLSLPATVSPDINEIQTKLSRDYSTRTKRSSGPVDLDDDIGSATDSDEDDWEEVKQLGIYQGHSANNDGWFESSGSKVMYRTGVSPAVHVVPYERQPGPIDLDEFSFVDSEFGEEIDEQRMKSRNTHIGENYMKGWSDSLSGSVSTPIKSNYSGSCDLSNRIQAHEVVNNAENLPIYANSLAIAHEVAKSSTFSSCKQPIPKLKQSKRDTPSVHKTRNIVTYAETRNISKNTSNCTDATSTLSSPSPSRPASGSGTLIVSPKLPVELAETSTEQIVLQEDLTVLHEDLTPIALNHVSQYQSIETRSMDSSRCGEKEANNTTYESIDDNLYQYHGSNSPMRESPQIRSYPNLGIVSSPESIYLQDSPSTGYEQSNTPSSNHNPQKALPDVTPDPPLIQAGRHRLGVPDSPSATPRQGSQRSQRSSDIPYTIEQRQKVFLDEQDISNDWEIQSGSEEWKSILIKTGVDEILRSTMSASSSNIESRSNTDNEGKKEVPHLVLEASKTKPIESLSPSTKVYTLRKKHERDSKYLTMLYKREYNNYDNNYNNEGRLGIRNMYSNDEEDMIEGIKPEPSYSTPDRTSPHLRNIANLSPIVDDCNNKPKIDEERSDENNNLSFESAVRKSDINEIIMGSDTEHDDPHIQYEETNSDAYGPTMEERGASSFLKRLQACVSPIVVTSSNEKKSEVETVEGTAASVSSIPSSAASILASQHLAFLRSQVSTKGRRFMPPSFCGHPNNVYDDGDDDTNRSGMKDSQKNSPNNRYATTAITGADLQISASIVESNVGSIQNVETEGTVTTNNRSSVASSSISNRLVRTRATMNEAIAKEQVNTNRATHIESTKNQCPVRNPQRVESCSTSSSSGDSSCDERNISYSTVSSTHYGYQNDDPLNSSEAQSV